MPRSTALPATDSRAALSVLAAFSAGVMLGARSTRSSRTRTLATIGAAALGTLALVKPSGQIVREAGKKRRAGRLQFSLVIPRPVEQVFALCADFENFPRYIQILKRVIDYGDGRSRWCANTPAGRTIEWNTITNKFVTNSVIGWRSVPGSEIEMSGLLRFSPNAEGTCVRIMLEYRVLSSSLRDAIAALLSRRNASVLEEEIRGLATRITDAPSALAKELPPVITAPNEGVVSSPS